MRDLWLMGVGPEVEASSGSPPLTAALEIVWLGHATVLIGAGRTRLLTDPLLRSRTGPLVRRAGLPVPAVSGVDAVLISHLHRDHLDLPSLRRLDRTTELLVPAGAGRLVRGLGFRSALELRPGESVRVGELTVTATLALHDSRRSPLGARAQPIGFLVEGSSRVYFAGDTAVFEGMADLAPELAAALLPVWGWGPRLGPGHLDPQAAAAALRLLRPAVAIPIHWGTLHPLGLGRRMRDRLTDPPLDFARAAGRLAPEVEVRILAPGDSIRLQRRNPPGLRGRLGRHG
jgi:L-ascorbate metabolism protein UlaG (beta-lactamase superfamily)